jgi:hypothetical protein
LEGQAGRKFEEVIDVHEPNICYKDRPIEQPSYPEISDTAGKASHTSRLGDERSNDLDNIRYTGSFIGEWVYSPRLNTPFAQFTHYQSFPRSEASRHVASHQGENGHGHGLPLSYPRQSTALFTNQHSNWESGRVK